MAKRKRVSDVSGAGVVSNSTPKAGPSTSVVPDTTEHDRPSVRFLLADGSGEWKSRLKPKRTLDDMVSKMIDKLGVDASPQQLRLAHVREGGREVDIWDEFDFSAFKSRAFASPTTSTPLLVKVYPPSASSSAITTTLASVPTTPSAGKSVSFGDTPTRKGKTTPKRKERKKDSLTTPAKETTLGGAASPTAGASTPLPAPPASSSSTPATPSTKTKKQKKKKDASSPALATPTTASAASDIPTQSLPETPTAKSKSTQKEKSAVTTSISGSLTPAQAVAADTSGSIPSTPSTEKKKKSKMKDAPTPKKDEQEAGSATLGQNSQPDLPASEAHSAGKQKPRISLSNSTEHSLFTTSPSPLVSNNVPQASSSAIGLPETPTKSSSTKQRKRKRDSTATESPISAAQSPPSLVAAGTSDAAGVPDAAQRPRSESPTKQPKKKKARKSIGSTVTALPASPSSSSATSDPSSSAVPTPNIVSPLPRGPVSLLNKYKPVRPSPLGRVTGPTSEAAEEDDEETTVNAGPVATPEIVKNKRRREKKVKKMVQEVEPLRLSLATASTVEENGPVVVSATTPSKPSQAADELSVESAEAPTTLPLQSIDRLEEEVFLNGEIASTPSKSSKAGKASASRTTDVSTAHPELLRASSESLAADAPESVPVQPTPSRKARAARKPKTPVVERPVTPPPAITGLTEEVPTAFDDSITEEVESPPASPPPVVPPKKVAQPVNGAATQIPISTPYLLYVRPQDPLPFVTSKFSSSSFERKVTLTRKDEVGEEGPEHDEISSSSTSERETSPNDEEPDMPDPAVPPTTPAKPTRTRKKAPITSDVIVPPQPQQPETPSPKQTSVEEEDSAAAVEEEQELVAELETPIPNGDGHPSPSSPARSSLPPIPAPIVTKVSDPPSLRGPNGRVVSARQAKLALRGGCIICGGPGHLQKDCPTVKEGVETLQALLVERKKERKTVNSEQAIEALEMWIDRLGRIASKVKGTSATTKGLPATPVVSAPADQSSPAPAAPVESPQARSPSPPPRERTPSPVPALALAPVASPESTASSVSDKVASPEPIPIMAASLPREHTLPPIHLKALATRKAGSISGLSVSDAVIETGSSESESDDEDDSDDGSASESDRDNGDDDSKSSSGSRNNASASETSGTRSRSASRSSTSSTSTPPPVDISTLDPSMALQHFLTAPLSQRQKRAARKSAAAMKDVNLEEEASDASEIESSPEPLPPSSFARIRRDSESSVGEFEEPGAPSVDGREQDEDEDEDEVMAFTQPPVILPSQQLEAIETLSVDGRGPASQPSDGSRRSFADLAAMSSPTPILAEFPGSIALREAIEEDEQPERDAMQVDVEQSDVEDRTGDEAGKTGHVISQGLMSPPSSTGELHHDAEPIPGTQLLGVFDNEVTPRPRTRLREQLRKRVSRSPSPAPVVPEEDNEQQTELQAPIEIRLTPAPASPPAPEESQPPASAPSPPRRRLRSASRDLAVEVPSPRRMTRSRSHASLSPQPPSQPTRRSTRLTTPLRSSQVDQLDPSSPVQSTLAAIAEVEPPSTVKRRSTRRQTTPLHSSQVDQLESSPARSTRMRTPRAGSTAHESDAEADLMKTPLVPDSQPETETEKSQSQSQRSPRAGLRTRPSPLFMSQGSQIPQTQAYNLFPANGSSSSDIMSANETPVRQRNGVAVGSSPSVDSGRGMGKRGSMVRISSPIIEESEETTPVPSSPPAAGQKEQSVAVESDHESEVEPAAEAEVVSEAEEAQPNGFAHHHSDASSSSSSSSDDEEGGSRIPIPIPRIRPNGSMSISSSQPIYPSLPRAPSQGLTPGGGAFPTLSSLPREALRKMKSTFGFSSSQPDFGNSSVNGRQSRASMGPGTITAYGRKGATASTSAGGGGGKESDSSSSDDSGDSSDEEKTPIGLKGRFAGGGGAKKRRTKSLGGGTPGSARVRGW
ncbi:hypothetical protein CI109_102245 [Kwoniella shandongensis]|uniref:Uncharacterized protein n=1 Tax=Kwoniella shandongensis TaxID=1734106 RepID=A0A5M6BYL6_9TREE|nr:uncharacterized protein CI109_003601 [Kwoniella shandongensis]KAA5527947.1 hypothetical protein CI109_003601 [Kwoniella shandongensis]